MTKIGGFFISIGIIASIGPIFGVIVRGTDASTNTPAIGIVFILLGLFILFISKGVKSL